MAERRAISRYIMSEEESYEYTIEDYLRHGYLGVVEWVVIS